MDRSKADRFLDHLTPLQGRLEAYCRRSLSAGDLVPDILQGAVANAYRDFHLYAEGTNFRAWIFAYVHREIQNANRRLRRDRHEELPDDVAGPEGGWGPPDDLPGDRLLLDDPDLVLDRCDAALAEGVRELRPVERAVLLLQAVGEFKYREIAEIVQVPIGTVMSALARARARLREHLAEYAVREGLTKGRGA